MIEQAKISLNKDQDKSHAVRNQTARWAWKNFLELHLPND